MNENRCFFVPKDFLGVRRVGKLWINALKISASSEPPSSSFEFTIGRLGLRPSMSFYNLSPKHGKLTRSRKPRLHYKTTCFHGKTRGQRRLWRHTGRFTRGQGNARDDAARASIAHAWIGRKAKGTGQKCEKPLGKHGFLAERTVTEHVGVFPIFLNPDRSLFLGSSLNFETAVSFLPPTPP
jgi:hypothetical protein